jgi:hypothetical protein
MRGTGWCCLCDFDHQMSGTQIDGSQAALACVTQSFANIDLSHAEVSAGICMAVQKTNTPLSPRRCI